MLETMSKKNKIGFPFQMSVFEGFASRMLLKLPFDRICYGSVTITIAEQSRRFEGELSGLHAELTIHKPFAFYWLLLTQGELGFAKAYLNEIVSTPSLYNLMTVVQRNRDYFSDLLRNKGLNFFQRWLHKRNHNSKRNSKKNISYHYDLGNAFYLLWLDGSMSYSSGIFEHDNQRMELAQENKYQRLSQLMAIESGDSVLEVGCGWGGMMSHLIKKGVFVKGLTLSESQKEYTENRLSDLAKTQGRPTLSRVAIQDYRDELGTYDHIVSIEMFEAVGKEYWHHYFRMLDRCLSQNGRVGLQIITIDEAFAEQYQSGVDFIQAYIFPGGLLPSVSQVEQLAEHYGFEVVDLFEFGQDYGKTCLQWQQRFNQRKSSLLELGYDEKFQKTWNYYLDYCRVGFESKHISVHQFILQRK